MKLRLGPYTLTLTLHRAPREPAPVPVPHAEGVRRLREEVAAAIPVDDGELERAKRVSGMVMQYVHEVMRRGGLHPNRVPMTEAEWDQATNDAILVNDTSALSGKRFYCGMEVVIRPDAPALRALGTEPPVPLNSLQRRILEHYGAALESGKPTKLVLLKRR